MSTNTATTKKTAYPSSARKYYQKNREKILAKSRLRNLEKNGGIVVKPGRPTLIKPLTEEEKKARARGYYQAKRKAILFKSKMSRQRKPPTRRMSL